MKRSYKQFRKTSLHVKRPSWKVKASIAWWRKQPGCYRSTHLSPQVTGKHEKMGSETKQHFQQKIYEEQWRQLRKEVNYTWETTLSITPPESAEDPRAGARESSSSKKMTHGRADLAWD
jgi:hypothetical protein